jgi:hypothetical protein
MKAKSWKVIRAFVWLLNLGSLRGRTPRTKFAINEEGVYVCHTDPPNRGGSIPHSPYMALNLLPLL